MIRKLSAAALLLLAGCGEAGDPAANADSPAAEAGGNAPSPAPAADVAANASTNEAGAALVYTLAGNGLMPGLAFGMAQAEAAAAATAAFGAPTDTGRNEECGEGPMDFVTFGGLQLAFQDGRLAGWTLSGTTPALRTAQGLTVGSPRSALGDAAVEQSTLGPEFAIEDVGGILDEQGATVEALWAGSTCQFR